MKKARRARTLVLVRETIRALAGLEMVRIAGGADTGDANCPGLRAFDSGDARCPGLRAFDSGDVPCPGLLAATLTTPCTK
jgi:hypothetical protein